MMPIFSNDWKFRLVGTAVFSLGVSAVMTQLALMREMLAAFSGNELVLGIILGNWMLLTGLGAWLGRAANRLRDPLGAMIVSLLLVAIIPPVQIVALREWRDVIFIRGSLVGVVETVAASLALLAPYCLVSGGLLTLACLIRSERDGDLGIGRVYFADSVGSIAGGILFGFVLIHWFDHFALLCFPAMLNLTVVASLAFAFRRWVLSGISTVIAVAILSGVSVFDVDSITTNRQFSGQDVVFRGQSPYGKLVVTRDSGQLNFIENGVPMFSTHNEAHVEETAHYAMSQRPDAKNVLLISGGVSGTAKELLKYPQARITYVELDPLIVEAGKKFLPDSISDPRIRVVTTDGRLFVKQTLERFDVVIVDVPDPSTSQINRFFTSEFYNEVKRALVKDGVLSFSLGEYASYVSRPLAQMLATASATLGKTFRHTLMIPGGRIYFLASDGELTGDIVSRIDQSGVTTTWVRRAYLGAMLAPDRMADLARAVQQPAAINTDFNPVLYFLHLVYWSSQFKSRAGFLAAALIIALAVYTLKLRPAPMAIFASGFAASGLEVVLLLGFQILCGSLYRQLGVIVSMFMLGLAIGAFLANRNGSKTKRQTLGKLALSIAVFSALLPLTLRGLQHVESIFVIEAVVSLLTMTLAIFVGMEFPLASRIESDNATASRLYTADFIGGFLGALLPSALVIPVFGVGAACFLSVVLNSIATWAVLRRRA